jgi:hypothetical protein
VQILKDLKSVWDGVKDDNDHWMVEPINEPQAHTSELINRWEQLPAPHYQDTLNAKLLSLRLRRFGIKPLSAGFRYKGKQGRGYKRSSFVDM